MARTAALHNIGACISLSWCIKMSCPQAGEGPGVGEALKGVCRTTDAAAAAPGGALPAQVKS